ncbi:DUF6480 family protein [Streptomyces collinus]|uniref:DUF6480 family protein n=2 Tax=Streptomyces TaxID=1883 RepID=UPI0036C4E4A5
MTTVVLCVVAGEACRGRTHDKGIDRDLCLCSRAGEVATVIRRNALTGGLEQQIGSPGAGEHVERRAIVRILEARLDQLSVRAHRLTSRSTDRAQARKKAERNEPMPLPREPSRTPQPAPGRGVSPGETPPAEASATSAISYSEPELRVGWGPVPLVLIMLVVALMVVGLIAMAVALMA